MSGLKRTVTVLVALGVLFPAALRATDVIIGDVLDNPSRWYNLEVTIQGQVVNVVPPPSLEVRGYYVLLDKSDKTIKVVGETLPAPQQKFSVTGIVQIDPETQVPFIREKTRIDLSLGAAPVGPGPSAAPVSPPVEEKGLSPVVIALMALIGVVVIALIVVLLRKKPAPAPAVAAPAPQAAAPQAPAAPAGTRQVSTAEIARQVGGIKTTQVPHILAQVTVLTGPQSGKSFPLKYETAFGREVGDVILEDSSVSREHAKISFAGDKYVLENKSTTNPVILNGDKIAAKHELKNGDEIICGFVKMKFSLI